MITTVTKDNFAQEVLEAGTRRFLGGLVYSMQDAFACHR